MRTKRYTFKRLGAKTMRRAVTGNGYGNVLGTGEYKHTVEFRLTGRTADLEIAVRRNCYNERLREQGWRQTQVRCYTPIGGFYLAFTFSDDPRHQR